MTTESTDTTTEQAAEIGAAPVEPEAPVTSSDDPTVEDEKAGKSNREAAKYRTRLRETEAERDALRSQLEALQGAEVARVAGERLARGADVLEVGGHALADFLDDEGAVDADRVAVAVAGLLEARGYLARRRFAGGADGGVRGEAVSAQPRMGGIFGAS